MQEINTPESGVNREAFKPFVPAEMKVAELTVRSIIMGAIFGIIFGMASVYLALKAGLTISASIPVAVISISLGRLLFKKRTTILENNIIQTTASAGESIASGVVFTLPAFLFLSLGEDGKSMGESYFNYVTIFSLAVMGGLLGTLMMIPLRRSLIVKEHGTLPYPEGTACGSVLIAGEKGGDFAMAAYLGVGAAAVYATLQRVFHFISDVPQIITKQTNRYYPSAVLSGEITPEYLGVGYIIGFRIAGVLVAGGVLAWLCLIPLLAFLVPPDAIATQLVKLGYLKDLLTVGGPGDWNPVAHTFGDFATALYKAYIRLIGAGMVAAGGFITLLKTIPTIVSSFRESVKSLSDKKQNGAGTVLRTDKDMSFNVVIIGSIALVLLMALLPFLPGSGILSKLLIGILVVVFGFFFVTVSSRIVGIIGSTNNPISGMTIATIMGTSLVFIAFGLTGKFYEPMVLVVGSMICIAAANGGATSQDLKTGYIVGATPRSQQIALFTGAVFSSLVIGITVYILDIPNKDMIAQGIHHAIGTTTYPAPQGSLMATLIKGLQSHNLDWQFVIVGVMIALVLELCHINSLSFAVGAYLPLSTTLPIFIGGCVKALSDSWLKHKKRNVEHGELGQGSLFATGLVAGGALFGVIVAMLKVIPAVSAALDKVSLEPLLIDNLGQDGYYLLGAVCFGVLAFLLYRMGVKKETRTETLLNENE